MRYIVTAILILVAIVTNVHAECTWVHWYKVTSKVAEKVTVATGWEPTEAFPKKSQCQEKINERIEFFRKTSEMPPERFKEKAEILITPSMIIMYHRSISKTDTMEFKCLPDTIKP